MRGWLRWMVLLVCLACLAAVVFGKRPHPWALVGFFVSGAAWYWMTWRRTRELDAPRSR